jgi:multiple sugar transport system substrate-binding protein
MELSRRQVLGAAGAFGVTALLAGCAGLTGRRPGTGPNTIRFLAWGSVAEADAFRTLIDRFEQENTGVTVQLSLVPYQQMFTNMDALLASGTAPDVFRVDYGNLGVYSSQGQLLDMSPYFDRSAVDAFIPALWEAISYDGTPFGVPHQTDTTAVLFDTAALEAAGITSVPDTLESAWSWEEFAEVGTALRDTLDEGRFPFVVNWQQAGASRWLSWLFQAGGRFLDEDLTASAIDSDAGRRALDFTKSFFTEGLVPGNTSIKAAGYADTVFQSGRASMAFIGNFLLPDVEEFTPFEYAATFLPQDVRAASDLGGNALAATAQTGNPDLAAEFLAVMVREDSMRLWCEATTELPTLQSLVDTQLDFPIRPELMTVYTRQATSITPEDVQQLSSPAMAAITTVLTDELELAFVEDRSTDATLAALDSGIDDAAEAA